MAYDFQNDKRVPLVIRDHPVLALLCVVVTAAAIYKYLNAEKPLTPAQQQMQVLQKQSVVRTEDNGVITYRFLSYPGIWSDPITIPADCHNVQFGWSDSAKLSMKVNGHVFEPGHHTPAANDVFQYMSNTTVPVPTTLRFFMREATMRELASPVPLRAGI